MSVNIRNQNGYSGAIVTADREKKMIDESNLYAFPFVTSSIAAAGTYKIGFTTPAESSNYIYKMLPKIFSNNANTTVVQILEDCNYTAAAAEQYAINANRHTNVYSPLKFYLDSTVSTRNKDFATAEAGGDFANQPAGDTLTIVSDDAGDVTQNITIYGTITGATTTITSETILLTGTDAIDTDITTWQTILGVEIDASCAGTITIAEKSGGLAITTITTGNLSAGIVTPSDIWARDQMIYHDASDASTAAVGIIGTAPDGTAISSVDDLNGTTNEIHGTLSFRTVTKILIGAVASTVDVTIYAQGFYLLNVAFGAGSFIQIEDNYILKPNTKYVIYITNAGATTATYVYGTINFEKINIDEI